MRSTAIPWRKQWSNAFYTELVLLTCKLMEVTSLLQLRKGPMKPQCQNHIMHKQHMPKSFSKCFHKPRWHQWHHLVAINASISHHHSLWIIVIIHIIQFISLNLVISWCTLYPIVSPPSNVSTEKILMTWYLYHSFPSLKYAQTLTLLYSVYNVIPLASKYYVITCPLVFHIGSVCA